MANKTIEFKEIKKREAKYKMMERNKVSFSDKSRFENIKYDLSKGMIVAPHQKKFYDKCVNELGWQ